jgi:hypothetical protein
MFNAPAEIDASVSAAHVATNQPAVQTNSCRVSAEQAVGLVLTVQNSIWGRDEHGRVLL